MHLLSSLSFLLLSSISQLATAQDCGPNIGSCASGLCCSQWGFCGTTAEHCDLGKCQPDFSDSCEDGIPDAPTNLPRPRLGNVPYGTIIDTCNTAGQVALTYDDGPFTYTSQLLDILSSLKAPATFFITGNNGNRGSIADASLPWPGLLRRMHAEGHQLAHHSWSHASLMNVSPDLQRAEIMLTENAFLDVLGFYPTYFRCPYLECDEASGTLGLLGEYGYHVIGTNADTKDYLFVTPETVQGAKDNFANIVTGSDASSFVVLAHDIHEQTVVELTRYMVETARARGFKLVTMGECLGDPMLNWYRNKDGNAFDGTLPDVTTTAVPTTLVTSTKPTVTPGVVTVSPDGTCGAAVGFTCAGSTHGTCCSQWGFCGVTPAHCGTGCVSGFGTCDGDASAVKTPAVPESVVTTPVANSPEVSTPVVTESVVTTPVVTEPVATSSVETSLVETSPLETTPVETTPAVFTPIVSTSVATSLVATLSAVASQVATGSVAIEKC